MSWIWLFIWAINGPGLTEAYTDQAHYTAA